MVAINYDWDEIEDNIVEEYDDLGATVATYTTEIGLYGPLICESRNGAVSQHHFDAPGSTLILTGDNGGIVNTYAYAAFGEVTEEAEGIITPFQYIGQRGYYRDPVTAGYIVRRRPYLSRCGRWASADPLSLSATRWIIRQLALHIYAYASDSPLSRRDLSGLKDEMMCDSCNRLLMIIPAILIPLERCLIRADCRVASRCVCCAENMGGCAFVGKDGSFNIRLCCGKSGEETLIHEYIHILRYCQVKKKGVPLAKTCADCIREELLSYICAGLCQGNDGLGRDRDARSCIESAFQSCLFAAGETDGNREKPKPRSGTQPCAEGEDPKAIPFVGCKKEEVERLRKNLDELVRQVKDRYGDPLSSESEACKGIFDIAKCIEFVPPEIMVP